MDFSSILDSLQKLLNDESSYPFIAVAVILGFFVIKKVMRLVAFVVIFGGIGLALAALQGYDISKYTDPIVAYLTDAFSAVEDKVGDATGGSTGDMSSQGEDVKKLLTDTFSK